MNKVTGYLDEAISTRRRRVGDWGMDNKLPRYNILLYIWGVGSERGGSLFIYYSANKPALLIEFLCFCVVHLCTGYLVT